MTPTFLCPGIQLEEFLSLYETAAEKPLLNEYQLFDALRTLDLTKTDTLEPKGLKDRDSFCRGFGVKRFKTFKTLAKSRWILP